MPQRWFYDSFILWLIPKTRRSIVATVACSWGVGLWRSYHMPHTMQQVGVWCVLGFYVPMLIVVMIRARSDDPTRQAGGDKRVEWFRLRPAAPPEPGSKPAVDKARAAGAQTRQNP
jgi:hypothetical protein